MTDRRLLLHLPLDERFGDVVRDASSNRRNATLVGAAEIVEDADFGDSLKLEEGGILSLPPIPRSELAEGLTIQLRLKPASGAALRLANNNIVLFASNEKLHLELAGSPPMVFEGTPPFLVAFSIAPSGEVAVLSPRGFNPPKSNPMNFDWLLDLERQPEDSRALSIAAGGIFSGVISDLRVYRGVLTALSPNATEDEEVSINAVAPLLPVAFSLTNEDGSPSLYIDHHQNGHTMRLVVGNVQRAPLRTAPLPGSATAESHHFQLSFRPGTLKDLGVISVGTPGWSLAKKPATPQDPVDSLFLMAPKNVPLPVEVKLRRFIADPIQGTRSTRIELQCRRLLNEAGVEVALPIRRQHFYLINHQGRRDVPVHVGFAESNRVTIDRSKELRLRITNLLPDLTPGDLGHHLLFDKTSRISITVDERAGTAWALASPQTVKQIEVRHGRGRADRTRPAQKARLADFTESSVWELSPNGMDLAPGQDLEVLLEKVRAEGSAGHSNVYVELINIPGYWDKRFTLPIEKIAPPVWTPLPLKMHWNAYDVPPAYYRDPSGMVHLRGWCVLELQTTLQNLHDHREPFALPAGYTPEFEFTKFGHFEFFGEKLEYALMTIAGSQVRPHLPPRDHVPRRYRMRIYLDGISYFGAAP